MPKRNVTTTEASGLVGEAPRESAGEEPKPTKKRLVKLPYVEGARPRLYQKRAIKMLKPRCDECQGNHNGRPPIGWWDDCKHLPYLQQEAVPVPVEVLTCEKCGATVDEGAVEHCAGAAVLFGETKYKRVLRTTPRMVEVRVDQAENSGQSVALYQRTKGYKFPQQLGFAPMCDFSRCYSPEIEFRVGWGSYCSRDHAAIAYMATTGRAIEVHDQDRLQDQVRGVAL